MASGLPGMRISDLATLGRAVFVAGDGGFWRSVDEGANWVSVAGRLPDTPITRLFAQDERLYVALEGERAIRRSRTRGTSWERVFLPESGTEADPVRLFAQSEDGPLFVVVDTGVHRSSDGGDSWATLVPPVDAVSVVAIAATSNAVYLSAAEGLFASHDEGETWSLGPIIPVGGIRDGMVW